MTWKCDLASEEFKCPGAVRTTGKAPSDTTKSTTDHTHPPNPDRVVAQVVKTQTAEDALSQPTATTHRLLAAALRHQPQTVLSQCPGKKTLKRVAQRARRVDRERRLDEGEEGILLDENSLRRLAIPKSVTDVNWSDFLAFDSGPSGDSKLILGAADAAAMLASSKIWGSGGTFKPAPEIFAQLYTVHGR